MSVSSPSSGSHGGPGGGGGVSSRHSRPLLPPTSSPSRIPPQPPPPALSSSSSVMTAPPTAYLGGLGPHKIRVTLLCASNLCKRELFRLPDPFVRLTVDGSAQSYCTNTMKNTLEPKWNQHYDLLLRPTDAITISVWNEKKVNKENATSKKASNSSTSSGFLGCVRLLPNAVDRLKDTGYQRLHLVADSNNPLPVKGQIVISLLSRDGHGTGKCAIITVEFPPCIYRYREHECRCRQSRQPQLFPAELLDESGRGVAVCAELRRCLLLARRLGRAQDTERASLLRQSRRQDDDVASAETGERDQRERGCREWASYRGRSRFGSHYNALISCVKQITASFSSFAERHLSASTASEHAFSPHRPTVVEPERASPSAAALSRQLRPRRPSA